MKKWFLEIFFGCSHSHITFPQSDRGEPNRRNATVCCLDCGKRWRYDFIDMTRCEEVR